MKLIHLTDLHIAPDGLSDALAGTTDRTVQAVDLINQKHADADLCVVTGDIVYDPDEAAYAMAEEILSKITIPTVSLIGNHDDRAMARAYLSSVKDDGLGFLQQSVPLPEGRAILLDTKAEGTHGGAFCIARQNWLMAQLEAHPGPVWLFMHHAPFAIGMPAMDVIGMKAEDADALTRILRQHGHVKHLFFGHYHRPMSGIWNAIPFSSHRSMMLQCALDLNEANEVPAIFEEPQFAVISVYDDRTIVHYDDFATGKPLLSMGVPEA